MVCTVSKVDSNVTNLAIAEEECLKQLPDVPVWFNQEPNSYSDTGADFTTTSREPITNTRQLKKGNITDEDASGGFNTDVTASNLTRLLQGFFFADVRARNTNQPINGTANAITGIAAGVVSFAGAPGFAVGQIVTFKNTGDSTFDGSSSDGLAFVISAVEDDTITLQGVTASLASVPASAECRAVGFVESGVVAALSGAYLNLTLAVNPNLIPGEWIYIDGATNKGFARFLSVASGVYTFDRTSFSPVAATEDLSIYVGTLLRSESDPTLIKSRSYQLERQLGDDDAGVQSAYLTGAYANQLTLNLKSASLVTADLTYVACDEEFRTGLEGLKSGTREAALGENGFNTTSDVVFVRMTVDDSATPNPQGLFGYVSDATLTIDNGATANKAIGVLGAFDISVGNFTGGGSATAYFTSVSANKAIRANADVGMHIALAAGNKGQLWDMPLLALGGGRLTIEKDKPITVALTPNGAQSKYGHTMIYHEFAYLPDSAMPA